MFLDLYHKYSTTIKPLLKRDLTVNYFNTKFNKWVSVNSLDVEITNNLLYKIIDSFEPINIDLYRSKFNFSIYKPAHRMSFVDFSPGKLVLNIDTNFDPFWDDKLFSQIRKFILSKRLFTFNPSYFSFDDKIDSWTTHDNRITFSVDRAIISEDIVRHIMSGAWLLLVGLISPLEFKELLDKLRSSFNFTVGYSQDSYVYIRAVPVLSKTTT